MENIKNSKYFECLFARGYIYFEDKKENDFYFLSGWNKINFHKGSFLFHPKTHYYLEKKEEIEILLIGHCYNPFTMQYDEKEILNSMLDAKSFLSIINVINELTGVFSLFIKFGKELYLFGDCCCMQSLYYANINEKIVFSSHAQLIGDVYNLEQSNYIKQMQKYRFWKKYGVYLPSDISQFDEVKRVTPNIYIKISENNKFIINRFFPLENNKIINCQAEYKEVIKKIASIMNNNLKLITKKWQKPAISMTGGMDSKTTVACANGLYDKFKFYSYISMDGDVRDAEAAHKIAEAIGVEHTVYNISDDDKDFKNIEELRNIIKHNFGEIGYSNKNDVRKRAFFFNTTDFDVEVKSWVSEIGRANYYKKFGVKKMPKKLSPRDMTTLYKLFLYNRKDAIMTDKIFKDFIQKTKFYDIFNYDSSDLFLWEIRYGSWGGLVITSEHRVSYDITIPYNNRLLMKEFLRIPLEKRIKDITHYDIIKNNNKKIDDLNITITNWNETKKRRFFERLYWIINRKII